MPNEMTYLIPDHYEASAKRYCELYLDPRRVDVNVRSARGHREPFVFRRSEESCRGWLHDVPFYLTYSQVNLLEGGFGTCYGRTETGPWCRLQISFYRIVNVKVVPFYEAETLEDLIFGGE